MSWVYGLTVAILSGRSYVAAGSNRIVAFSGKALRRHDDRITIRSSDDTISVRIASK
jgi:hypothetical protein